MSCTSHRDVRERVRSASAAFTALIIAGSALACSGSQPANQPPRDAHSAGEPPVHAPQPRAEAEQPELGTLHPVTVPEQPEPTATPAAATPPAPTAEPIRIAPTPAPKPYPLHDHELSLPGGLIIHNVPRRVAIRTVTELATGDAVLEFIDANRHRIALLKETPLNRVALSGGPSLLEATAATHARSQRDWGKTPVTITVDRFQSDTSLYTLERQEPGTEWMMSGMELTSHR